MPLERISSSKYVAGAKGQPCSFQIPGVCNHDPATTVFAHIRDAHTGRSIKASDISGADACFACHAKFDGQAGEPLSSEDWLFYALRGLQTTLENRITRGLMFVPQDAPKPFAERSVKPRKPPAERRKVQPGGKLESRPTNWPSRPFPARTSKER